MKSLFKKQSIDQLLEQAADKSHTGLPRQIGLVSLTFMGIGAVIGAGIFSLPGFVAAKYTGPGVILSFAIAAFVCAIAALCYAEFASMVPVAGSAYAYTYATIGLLPAWIIGWDLILEYAVAAAVVAISWSQYLVELLKSMDLHIPVSLTTSPGEGGIVNLPAVFIIFAISLLLMRGMNLSAKINALLVIIKVVVILVFIASGWAYINADHYSPFIPQNTGTFGEFGWSGVFKGASVVFFAFLGFDAISTAAQEVKNPQRTLPIGILASLFICTALYMLFSYVFIGLVNQQQLNPANPDLKPVLSALSNVPALYFLKVPVNVAILVGYVGVMMIMLLAQSRTFFAMSRDKLVPPIFGQLHKKFKTPAKSNLIFAVFTGAVAGFTPKVIISDLVSIGALFAFAMVCAGVMILRHTQPNLERKFKVPLYPVVPVVGILSCLVLMYTLSVETWMRLFVWLAIGLIIFFAYGIKRVNYHADEKKKVKHIHYDEMV